MPIVRTYTPSAAALAQVAYQAGLGQYDLGQQQRNDANARFAAQMGEQARQFDAQMFMRGQQMAQGAVDAALGRQMQAAELQNRYAQQQFANEMALRQFEEGQFQADRAFGFQSEQADVTNDFRQQQLQQPFDLMQERQGFDAEQARQARLFEDEQAKSQRSFQLELARSQDTIKSVETELNRLGSLNLTPEARQEYNALKRQWTAIRDEVYTDAPGKRFFADDGPYNEFLNRLEQADLGSKATVRTFQDEVKESVVRMPMDDGGTAVFWPKDSFEGRIQSPPDTDKVLNPETAGNNLRDRNQILSYYSEHLRKKQLVEEYDRYAKAVAGASPSQLDALEAAHKANVARIEAMPPTSDYATAAAWYFTENQPMRPEAPSQEPMVVPGQSASSPGRTEPILGEGQKPGSPVKSPKSLAEKMAALPEGAGMSPEQPLDLGDAEVVQELYKRTGKPVHVLVDIGGGRARVATWPNDETKAKIEKTDQEPPSILPKAFSIPTM